MIAIDTNVIIYAHRSETPRHAVALQRLRELAEGETPWALPVFCAAEFVRVVTHLRVFTPASSLSAALLTLERLVESPSARLLLPTPSFLDTFRNVCERASVRGNLAFDAQIAALCLEHGVDTILTADRDFARFTSLTTMLL